MSGVTLDAINRVLDDFPDPETGRGVRGLGQVSEVALDGDRLKLTLALTTAAAPLWQETRADLVERLQSAVPGLKQVDVNLAVHVRPPEKLGEIGLTAKHVIAVGSGKGGVGKSTLAASIAYGLKRAGCEVGLMDADIYGPSIPHLIGVNQRPEIIEVTEGHGPEARQVKRIQPIVSVGGKAISMGFLMAPNEPVVWRGPMLHGAITQLLRDTLWGDLDYLIIDMPPGTGDIALTLSQLLPLTGAVVVCTPQDVALLDATKAIGMFRKVNIPVLGMIENMSYFLCPDNGKRYDIFGHGGAQQRAAELEVPFLGEVPINIQIRINGDEGKVAASYDNVDAAPYFEAICHRLIKNLAQTHRAKPVLPSLNVL